MMRDLLLLIRIQARIATFLADLTTERLVALAEGHAELVVIDASGSGRIAAPPDHAPATVAPAPARARPRRTSSPEGGVFDADAVAAQLRACETLDQGTELLSRLKLTVTDVRLLAKVLKVPQSGRKDDVIKKILHLVFGGRSKHAALQDR